MMLSELCAEVRNYFCSDDDKYSGHFTIAGGTLSLEFLKEGQFYCVTGSTFNDGVHQYPSSDLIDEDFDGSVWAMDIPPSFIALADEIELYQSTDAAKPSGFTSESFGGYSYSRATDSNGVAASWETVFAKKLNKWRRIHI